AVTGFVTDTDAHGFVMVRSPARRDKRNHLLASRSRVVPQSRHMDDALPRGSPPIPVTPAEIRREHQLTRLLAMSFDSAASPSITLRALTEHEERDNPYGWGFAWYPDQTPCALVVKDPTSIGENAMTKLLREWERFESTVFFCHLRGAARTI